MAAVVISPITNSNLKKQDFPFSKKLINYFLGKANASIIQKLYRTCKYFYLKAPYFIVDTLDFSYGILRFENEKYDDCLEVDDILQIHNIWITKEIKADQYQCSEYFIDIFFSKIIKCEASKINISKKTLLFKHFEILTKFGKVEDFHCYVNEIIDVVDNNSPSQPLEVLLALVSNAKKICLKPCPITPETMTKLLYISWKNKIEGLFLYEIGGSLEAELFQQFLKKATTSDARIRIQFKNKNEFKKDFDDIDNEDGGPVAKKIKIEFADNKQIETRETEISSMTFTTKNFYHQNFPFRQSLINYIVQNANSEIMKKLHKTCKYFYNKSPFCIVESLEIYNERIIIDEIFPYENTKELDFIDNIWITGLISYSGDKPFKTILPRFSRFDPYSVSLYDITLTKMEYNFLTQSNKMQFWTSERTPILNIDKSRVPLDELFIRLTHAINIKIDSCHITLQTFKNLLSLPWKKEIDEIFLNNLDVVIDADVVFEFMKKVVNARAAFVISFLNSTNEEISNFDLAIRHKIRSCWKPQKDRPRFWYMDDDDEDDFL